jgi:hypothetical protein
MTTAQTYASMIVLAMLIMTRKLGFLLLALLCATAGSLAANSYLRNTTQKLKDLDTYPNSSEKLSELIKAKGAGTYNLFQVVNARVTGVCVSLSGGDPRALAVQHLAMPKSTFVTSAKDFFVREDLVSILFLHESGFEIQTIDRRLADITGHSSRRNFCVNTPTVAALHISLNTSVRRTAPFLGDIEIN